MYNLFGNIYKDKTVLLTGHTGFKGSWLALWLSKMGAKVIGYSLSPHTNPNHISLLNLNVESILGDICDLKRLTEIFEKYKPQIVFHLAAQAIVRCSYEQPVETFKTNVVGTLQVLEAARKCGSVSAFVAVTSDKVYENNEWEWGYREKDALGGYDPYSASKGCAELAIAAYRRSFLNINDFGRTHEMLLSSVRAGNVIGGGDWATDRLIPDIVRATVEDEPVVIRNPSATRPWQHVIECLSGYLLVGQQLFEKKIECAEAWNFGPSEDGVLTVGQIVTRIANKWPKVSFKLESPADSPHEARFLKLDCSKARQHLMWHPIWNADEALDVTTNWYRCYYENGEILSESDLEHYISIAKAKGLIWSR